ncbi:MAG: M23 family metallopeptidase [Deltaproteobacteria bacterium]|nr:M23 family metallopeptidase [Deltaproteobacteria bacterium]
MNGRVKRPHPSGKTMRELPDFTYRRRRAFWIVVVLGALAVVGLSFAPHYVKSRIAAIEHASPDIHAAVAKDSDAHPGADEDTTQDAESDGADNLETVPPILYGRDEFFVLRVVVHRSLLGSLIDAMPDNVQLARALASTTEGLLRFRMNTRTQMAPLDTATFVFKEGDLKSSVRLYGLRYQSRLLSRTIRAYYYWETDRRVPEYFDASGEAIVPRIKQPPVAEYERVDRRYSRKGRPSGVDFLTEAGVEVTTPFPAKVRRINWRPKEEGRCVEMEYVGTGVFARITRLSSLSVKVNPGEELAAGSVIAKVGDLREGKGNGLRYELFRETDDGEAALDPFDFHMAEPYHLSGGNEGMFAVVKQRLDLDFEEAERRALAAVASEKAETP